MIFRPRHNLRRRLLGLTVSALLLGPLAAAADTELGQTSFGNYLAGRHAQATHDLTAATDYLGAALAQAPKAPDLLRRTFVLMTIEGRIEEALTLAKRLLKDKPKSPIANLVLAVDDLKQGRYAGLQKRLKAQPQEGLNGFTAPLLSAWGYAGQKKFDAALTALAPLAENKGSEALHDMHRALILEFAGKTTEAEAALIELTKDESLGSFRLVQHLGRLYERQGKRDAAGALYQRYRDENAGSTLLDEATARLAAKRSPSKQISTVQDGAAEALFSIGNSLRQQSARETAMVVARLALYLKPVFPITQVMIADILEGTDRLADANAIYRAIPMDSPFRESSTLRLAVNLNKMDQTDAALEVLEATAKRRATDPRPLIQMGDVLRREERWDEAIVAYDRAVRRIGELDAAHWRMLYTRGIALERANRWPDAERDFLKALEFEPDQPDVLNYLGYSWIDKGMHLDRAQEMIRKAVSLRPNDGYIVDSLGWAYFRTGSFAKAVSELERAVEYRPEDPVINDHLGDAFWRVGRRVEARFQWRRALSLKPSETVINEIKKKLKQGLADNPPERKSPDDTAKASTPDKS